MTNNSNFKLYFYLIAFSLIIITLIFPTDSVRAYKDISPLDVKSIIDSSSDTLIIDVRTPEEFKQGHLVKSINIPLQILKETITAKNINKSTKIVVYCQSGIRSRNAAQILESLGYKNVFSLGGLNNWPYDLVKD